MWKALVYQDKAGEWRWHIKSVNGNIVAESGEGYKNRGDCVRMLETLSIKFKAKKVETRILSEGE